MALTAGAESASRRCADPCFVDEAQRKRPRIGKTIDREEQIERRLRLEEANAPGLGQSFAQRVTRAPAALDLPGEERFALLERRSRGALVEDRDPGGSVFR